MKLILDNANPDLVTYIESHAEDALKSTPVEVLTGVDFQFDNTAESRWNQLVLAGQGARYWSNTPHPNSPLYAGSLPESATGADLVLADLAYTKQQFDFYNKRGLTYIGRVHLDPRAILVIDQARKVDERHDKVLPDALNAFLSAAPEDWWGMLGVVSASKPDKLEALLDELPDVVPMVYSTGAASKLKFIGREYAHLNKPVLGKRADYRYGVNARSEMVELSHKMAQPEDVPEEEVEETVTVN